MQINLRRSFVWNALATGGVLFAAGCSAPIEGSNEQVSQALGSTHYVAPNGSDSGSGTASDPWRTLQKAVDSMSAGDVVLVRSGTYAGARIESSGRADAPKVIKAAPGEHVVLDRPGSRQRHDSIVEVENFDSRVSYWVIEGFEITGANRSGVDIRNSDYITVKDCDVHHNGRSGRATGIFLAFANFPSIEGNVSAYNTEHGIYQSNSGDDALIVGNTLHHNTASGIHLNGDASFGDDGIVSRSRISGNVIYENGASGGSAINMDGASDSVVSNNLIFDNHASGMSLFQADAAEPSSRNKIYNNVIVQPSDARWAINVAAGTGNQVKNNVLAHANSARGVISIGASSVSGFDSDYNAVMGRFSADDQSSTLTLASWKSLGYERHSIEAAPEEVFADIGGHDFRAFVGSPLVDGGTALIEVLDDLDGLERPQGGLFDIGCYELVADDPTRQNVPECMTASSQQPWQRESFDSQSGTFTAHWVVTPTADAMDGAVGLSAGAADAWRELAAIVRFNTSGNIDVRDGGTYRADRTYQYRSGTSYTVRAEIDVAVHRYSVYVAAPGVSEQRIAQGYAFRTEQQSVTRLDNSIATAELGGLAACDFEATAEQ